MRVNPGGHIKDFIGDPDKMAGSHFSGSTEEKKQDVFSLEIPSGLRAVSRRIA